MGAMHRLFRDWKGVEVDSRVFFFGDLALWS
jgi:hypothetical protein